ncbi:hypothetical protein LSAT2_007448 [Lamellibrachia satsuma]|nr:hypothetical protein LSAT2_007448 [Lamellibrachia satsuma]
MHRTSSQELSAVKTDEMYSGTYYTANDQGMSGLKLMGLMAAATAPFQQKLSNELMGSQHKVDSEHKLPAKQHPISPLVVEQPPPEIETTKKKRSKRAREKKKQIEIENLGVSDPRAETKPDIDGETPKANLPFPEMKESATNAANSRLQVPKTKRKKKRKKPQQDAAPDMQPETTAQEDDRKQNMRLSGMPPENASSTNACDYTERFVGKRIVLLLLLPPPPPPPPPPLVLLLPVTWWQRRDDYCVPERYSFAQNLHLKRQKVTVVVLSDNMASNALPVPAPLEIHDTNAADKWRKFLAAWENYALATELDAKPQAVQVATLLTVIGEDGREVHSTFRDWAQDGDDRRILPVLKKFAEYCQPRKNVPFERYKFNKRMQERGEPYEQYKTALHKLSEACEFDTITPNEILRDRLIFGIHDTKKKRVKKKETSHTTKSEATKECWNCGRQHGRESKELCPAFGKTCDCCGKSNHFAKKCRQKRSGRAGNSVRTIGESEEVFPVREVATLAMLDDSQCVTLKLDSGSYIRFQIDSGAQCNVVPLKLYQRATKDVRLKDVNRCQSSILAFGGSRLTVVGEVHVRVWRGDYKCILVCKLVDNDNIRPILGRKACVGMKLIQYTDNDALHKPATRGEQVYAVEGALISKAAVIEKYATVFGDGIGELEGEYQIRLDDAVDPIQHAPRRVPVALRDRLKATLDDMTRDDIIEAVEKPTAWISSMVVITKKDSKLRICLDPKDLNRAIRRENCSLFLTYAMGFGTCASTTALHI